MKKIDVLPVISAACFLLAGFMFAGMFLPVDYNDSYRIDDINISFESPESFVCAGKSQVSGCAIVNGSEMRLSRSLGFLNTYLVCNHEMRHIDGYRHEGMSVFEMQGLRHDSVCSRLVFGKVI